MAFRWQCPGDGDRPDPGDDGTAEAVGLPQSHDPCISLRSAGSVSHYEATTLVDGQARARARAAGSASRSPKTSAGPTACGRPHSRPADADGKAIRPVQPLMASPRPCALLLWMATQAVCRVGARITLPPTPLYRPTACGTRSSRTPSSTPTPAARSTCSCTARRTAARRRPATATSSAAHPSARFGPPDTVSGPPRVYFVYKPLWKVLVSGPRHHISGGGVARAGDDGYTWHRSEGLPAATTAVEYADGSPGHGQRRHHLRRPSILLFVFTPWITTKGIQ
jgi:hypothetical protein